MENAAIRTDSRRVLEGIVISNKMNKSITVEVTRTVRHPKYNKFVKKRARYHAHDEGNQAQAGDAVSIIEANPISKTKRWQLKEIVEKAE